MALALRFETENVDASASATTVPFTSPASGSIVANDIWICFAVFRLGSAGTISGVPASFHLIQRVDQGSGSTTCTIVAYWYLATGSETASSTSWQTITLGAASKHVTGILAYSGANTTNPISGTVATGTAAGANVTTNTLQAIPNSDFLVSIGGQQGSAGVAGIITPNTSGSLTRETTTSANTSGGSGATNVGLNGTDNSSSAPGLVSQTYNMSNTNTTACLMAFDLAIAAAATFIPADPMVFPNNAVRHRAFYL